MVCISYPIYNKMAKVLKRVYKHKHFHFFYSFCFSYSQMVYTMIMYTAPVDSGTFTSCTLLYTCRFSTKYKHFIDSNTHLT